MNSKKLTLALFTLILFCGATPLHSAEKIATMRGSIAINETSAIPENKSWAGKSEAIDREFDQQPPLIPHKSQSFKINLSANRCLSCHGPETYKAKGAVGVSESHFVDRDGKRLANVSASRYFCTQCHVEQRDTQPLVVNEFESFGKPDS